jgi:hypothetical protein
MAQGGGLADAFEEIYAARRRKNLILVLTSIFVPLILFFFLLSAVIVPKRFSNQFKPAILTANEKVKRCGFLMCNKEAAGTEQVTVCDKKTGAITTETYPFCPEHLEMAKQDAWPDYLKEKSAALWLRLIGAAFLTLPIVAIVVKIIRSSPTLAAPPKGAMRPH